MNIWPCHDSDDSVAAEMYYSPPTENEKPEPKEDIDLLVDHIQGENANGWKI